MPPEASPSPDVLAEGAISLTAAARAIPAVDGKRPNPSTVWRWCRHGVRGVKLEYVRLGRRIVTSQPAVARFARRLADADADVGDVDVQATKPAEGEEAETRSDTARARAVAAAEGRLAKAGI